ncbi:hypothetical protein MRB53_000747 [Persea americana]|uniref:Uncharacterized protein n=1 Tax=Persea americana TaxID=3435 RepID=A0ACC2MPQ5_PERAE|nr:hypothetical protein MRB53_000747 [Persea americana]
MPAERKTDMLQAIQAKFDLGNNANTKRWVYLGISTSWRNWKAELKKKYYNPYHIIRERLQHCPARVNPDQWAWLARSRRNSRNREAQTMSHTAGTKSFARIRDEAYYAQLRSTILSQDPLPSLNRVFQQIAQDERVRGITRITEEKPEVVGFAVRIANRTQPRLDRAERAALVCSHCHKSGHDIATCFDLHGTLDWYLEKYGNTYEGKGNVKGKTNAPSTKTSAGRGRGGVRANATTPDITHSAPLGQPSPAPGAQPLPGFTAEQWAALAAAFGTPQTRSNRLHAFAHNQRARGDKFASRSRKCVFVGYPFGKKGWSLFDLEKMEFFVSRDVKFYENVFPYLNAEATTITPTVESDVTYNGGDIEEFLDDVGGHRALHEDVIVATQTPQTASPTTSDTPSHEETQPSSTSVLSQNARNVPTVAASSTGAGGVDGTTGGSRGDNLGRGLREKFPLVKLRDYVTHTVIKKSPSLAPPDPDSHTPSDQTGTYKIPVPDDHENEICEMVLVSNPQMECATAVHHADRARVALTRNNGIVSDTRYANNLGFLKDAPMVGCSQLLKKYQEYDD